MIKGFPIKPDHIGISAYMIGMAALTGPVFNNFTFAVITLTLFSVFSYFFMTIQTQRRLIRLKRLMTGRALIFILCMSLYQIPRHHQLFKLRHHRK